MSSMPPGDGSWTYLLVSKEPTAPNGVKEHLDCLAWGAARHAGRTSSSDHMLINMTLGNGYLGSRIDEERSKMRYLV